MFVTVSQYQGLGQASAATTPPISTTPPPGLVQITDPKIAGWAASPNTMAANEVAELYQNLDALKTDSNATASYLKSVHDALTTRRQRVDALKTQLQTLKNQGMGELIQLERESGSFADPGLSGNFFSDIRKGVSHAFQQIDKHVIQPVAQPVKDAGHFIDKNVTQKIAHPVGHAFAQLDKHVLAPVYQPVAHPIGNTLAKFDKYTLRPGEKFVAKSMKTLDKYVPGWMTLLDFVVPLPGISSIIGNFAENAAGGSILQVMGLPDTGIYRLGSNVIGVASNVSGAVISKAADLASPVTVMVQPATNVVGQAINAFPLTISKGTHTFLTTKGSLLQKLEATSIEAMSGFALAVSIAASVVSGGAAFAGFEALEASMVASVQLLNLALTALQTGVTLIKVKQASDALKKAARAAKAAADAELRQIAADEASYMAQIAAIQAQIDAIKAERARLLASQRLHPSGPSGPSYNSSAGGGGSTPGGSGQTGMVIQPSFSGASTSGIPGVSQVATALGVSDTTVIVGGLAGLAGLVVVVSLIRNSSED